jgi:hypothetical protein
MNKREKLESFDIDSQNEIIKVIELAMVGARDGNVDKLKQAFHREARMFGEVEQKRYDEPISSFFKLCKSHPLGKGGRYRFRIVSTTRVGGAAMVMVAEDGCWGSGEQAGKRGAAFVDFFTVTRTSGVWQITNKTFAFTGGVIPPEVVA